MNRWGLTSQLHFKSTFGIYNSWVLVIIQILFYKYWCKPIFFVNSQNPLAILGAYGTYNSSSLIHLFSIQRYINSISNIF
jgi:hypothetical protein